MSNRHPSRRRGFTLIETIAAVVVLSIAVPPLLWSVRGGYVDRVNPVLTSKARWLVTEKLEEIVADRHAPLRGYSYLAPGNYAAEPTIAWAPGFSRSVTFTERAPDLVSAGTGYMIVEVTVSWTDAGAAARSLAVSTVLTEYTTP